MIYTYTRTLPRDYTHTNVETCTHIHIHIYIYIHTHTHTHTHSYTLSLARDQTLACENTHIHTGDDDWFLAECMTKHEAAKQTGDVKLIEIAEAKLQFALQEQQRISLAKGAGGM